MSIKRTKSELGQHPQSIMNRLPSFGMLNTIKDENFKFISEDYSKYLNCPLCKKLMIRPMRFHPCGHTFCQKCIEPFMSINKKVCPIFTCLKKCSTIQNDRTAESLIDQLKVECTNEGCVWKGQYDNYKKTHKDTCILKNGGLGRWLSQLTTGINIRPRITNEHQDIEKQQSHDKNITHSQHLLRNNEINDYSQQAQHRRMDKIQEQQKIVNRQQRQIERQIHEIDKQKKDYLVELLQDRQKIQQKYISESREDKFENANHLLVQNEIQKSQPVPSSRLLSNNQPEQIISRRITNNTFIANLPFGPSLDQQAHSLQRKKSTYIKKELKKLQS